MCEIRDITGKEAIAIPVSLVGEMFAHSCGLQYLFSFLFRYDYGGVFFLSCWNSQLI